MKNKDEIQDYVSEIEFDLEELGALVHDAETIAEKVGTLGSNIQSKLEWIKCKLEENEDVNYE